MRPLLALIPSLVVAVFVDVSLEPTVLENSNYSPAAAMAFSLLIGLTLLIPAALVLAWGWMGMNSLVEITGAREKPSNYAGLLLGLSIGVLVAGILHLILFRRYFAALDISFLQKKGVAGTIIGMVSWIQLCGSALICLMVAS